jgi:hypothetical protein
VMSAHIYNQTKLNIAVTRFAGFVSHLPLSPNEDDIFEYHEIIALFGEACGQDLSQFRIAPDRVKPEEDTTRMASFGARWQTRRRKKNSVEFAYFRGQVRGLINCLMTVLGSRPC